MESKLVPQRDDRPLDQYLDTAKQIMKMVQDQKFLNALNVAWMQRTNTDEREVLEALVMELRAFPRAQSVYHETGNPDEAKEGWRRLLERASVTIKSTRDILENLPPWAKSTLTLFKELVDIFRAR